LFLFPILDLLGLDLPSFHESHHIIQTIANGAADFAVRDSTPSVTIIAKGREGTACNVRNLFFINVPMILHDNSSLTFVEK
jgi:hypothetical protein